MLRRFAAAAAAAAACLPAAFVFVSASPLSCLPTSRLPNPTLHCPALLCPLLSLLSFSYTLYFKVNLNKRQQSEYENCTLIIFLPSFRFHMQHTI